jgi:propionyl-CoA synthetase
METKDIPGKIYQEVYQRSLKDPEGFWGKIAENFHWYRKWDKVLDDSNPPFFRWFPGGKTNLCYNAVDRHVINGLKDTVALIYESAAQGTTRNISYGELYREVNRFAGVLKNLGTQKGDRVLFFMPTVPEAIFAMLACVRIGAIHVGVFTGYGTDALAKRIDCTQPKILLTADGSFRRNKPIPLKETVDKVLEKAPVETVIVLNRGIIPVTMKPGRDLDWAELLETKGADYVEPLPLGSEHPSHVLFTSGDTHSPRGVVSDTGGMMVGLCNSLSQIYGVKPGDVFWATSDIGWRVGHNYTTYAPLLSGVTSLMFDGTPDFPDHSVYWRLIEKHRVNVIFSVPTVFKMLKRFGIENAKKFDTSSLRHLFLAGEYLDVDTWQWATEALDNRPVIDHYWLTEAGWPMLAVMMGVGLLPIKPGSPTKPTIGWDLAIVDKNGNPLPSNTKGYIVAKPPLPPGNIMTLWGADEVYKQEYWQYFTGKSLFLCGDYAVKDEDGYYAIRNRSDEVINIAAHRVSTREIAEAIASHPAVAEVSVIGVADTLKGEEAVGLVVLKQDTETNSQVKMELRNLARDKVGAIAAPKDIRFVPSLPKNQQGKYLRAVFKAVYEKRGVTDFENFEEDAGSEEIKAAFELMEKALGS